LTLCLLNAAEPDPTRLPPDPESRGVLLWEILHLESAAEASVALARQTRRLGGIRAFHLVAAEPGRRGEAARTIRLRWDGTELLRDEHRGPYLYVSSSLAQVGAGRARLSSWKRLLSNDPRPNPMSLARWLASHEPERGPLSVCMHHAEARTVSRTLVSVSPAGVEMSYLDGSPCDPAEEHTLRL
jgi:hypothetical protein